jgi:hypothetical protein
MKDDRPYWNMEIEPKFNTPEMQEIQEIKLRGKIKVLRASRGGALSCKNLSKGGTI